MCLVDNTAMAIFKFDCFIPYCCFWGFWDLVWLWLLSLYRLALRIRELLVILMTVILHLFSDSKTDSLSEKWIDLTTAIVFLHPISLVFILQ
jgi:hypothetical protein